MIRTLLCIAGIWWAIDIAFALGEGFTAITVLSIPYLVASVLMVERYRNSRVGRKWLPRAFYQYFEWAPLVRLGQVAPPVGALLANTGAVLLAAHAPLLMWCNLPFVVREALASRGASRS